MTTSDLVKTMQRGMGELFSYDSEEQRYRITTPFLYPDGDNIVLFFQSEGDSLVVTDLGEATGWIWDNSENSVGERFDLRQGWPDVINDIRELYRVSYFGDELRAKLEEGDSLADVVLRVAQAVLRVVDIWVMLAKTTEVLWGCDYGGGSCDYKAWWPAGERPKGVGEDVCDNKEHRPTVFRDTRVRRKILEYPDFENT